MMGDTVKRDMAKLKPNSCPDLSGTYALTGMVTRSIENETKEQSKYDSLLVPNTWSILEQLPYDHQENMAPKINAYFKKLKPDVEYDKRGMLKRRDFRDKEKINGAYVELKLISGNEYIVNVYSNSKQLLGAFKTKLLDKNSICHDNKYYTFYQEPSAHMVGEDEAFTMRRSSQEVMFYRSESGALVREAVSRTKTVIFGIIPFTQQDPGTIVTFPLIQ